MSNRYDEASPEARQLLADFDEIDLAEIAASGQAASKQLAFARRILEIFARADAREELLWWVADEKISFSANVSDVFAWGGADAENVTPERLPLLEQALADLKAIDCEHYLADLYAARIRRMRPQGAAYPNPSHLPDVRWRELIALFDACGPEREIGFGNPKPQPTATPEEPR